MTNEILGEYAPTGASAATAKQDGLTVTGTPASEKLAHADVARILRNKPRFDAASAKFNLPPALLAGIASRESRGGAVLDKDGWGDNGNAFGIMQVDKRFHQIQGAEDPASQAHIDQATAIVKSYFGQMQEAHADWPPARRLQGAVVAYNSGPGNVKTLGGMDVGTTGNDYSNDVWARARSRLHQALKDRVPIVCECSYGKTSHTTRVQPC